MSFITTHYKVYCCAPPVRINVFFDDMRRECKSLRNFSHAFLKWFHLNVMHIHTINNVIMQINSTNLSMNVIHFDFRIRKVESDTLNDLYKRNENGMSVCWCRYQIVISTTVFRGQEIVPSKRHAKSINVWWTIIEISNAFS